MKTEYKQETVKEEWKYTNEVRCAGGGMILYPWPSISNQSSNSANRPDLYNSDLCWTFDHTVTRWFQCNEIRPIQHFRVWSLEPYMPTCTRHRDRCVGLNCVWVWMWVCHDLCNKLTNITSLWITHFSQFKKIVIYGCKILWPRTVVQTHINHDKFYIHSFSCF